ncbi:MAG: MMPL family transporter, partial [Myxococcota bacterium]
MSLPRGRALRVAAVTWTLMLLGLAFGAPRPTTDNSVDALLASHSPDVEAYRQFQTTFGSDELVVVRLEGGRPFERFQLSAAVTATLTAAPSMRGVLSVASVHPEITTVILDEVFGGPETLQQRASSLFGPLVDALSLWTDKTAHIYGLAEVSTPEARAALLTALNQLREQGHERDVKLYLTGPPFLNLALDRAGKRTEAVALPLLLIVAVLVLLLTTGSIRATIALLLPVGLTVLATDGAFALAGGISNILVNIAKPLLFVVGLASAIHVLTEARQTEEQSPWAAARAKSIAVTTALVTTAIGFGSLGLSTVAPIRAFGLLAGAGLLAMIPTVLLIIPWLLQLLNGVSMAARDGPRMAAHAIERAAQGLMAGSLRVPYLAPLIAVGVIAVGAWALPNLPAEPHAIRYLSADHPLRQDQAAMEAAGLGVATVEAIFEESGITKAERVESLLAFAREAADLPGVATTV